MKVSTTLRITSAAMVLAGLAACGSAGEPSATTDTKLAKMTFRGPFVTSGGDAPMYYARALGFYEDVGIDLDIKDSKSSAQTVNDIAAGGSEFGEANGSSIMLAVASGRPVIAVASTVGKSSFGFFVPKDSAIVTPSDLDGKKVAAIPTMKPAMNAALAAAGLSADQVSAVFTDSNALITTYLSGDVDALYTSALLRGALGRRPSKILLQADSGYNPPDYALVVNPEFLAQKPELVHGFVSATLKGFQAARENPNAAIDALLRDHPELNRGQANGVLVALSDFLCAHSQSGRPYGWNAEKDWSVAAEALRRWAGMSGDADTSRFVTNQLFEGKDAIDAGAC